MDWNTKLEKTEEALIEVIEYRIKADGSDSLDVAQLQEDMAEVLDSMVPTNTTDTLSIAASNSFLNHSNADIGYERNATPVSMLNTNIYELLSAYAADNTELWIAELTE